MTTLQGEQKVVGYFASRSATELFCDDRALLIAGSHETLRQAISLRGGAPGNFNIRKTRFGEILTGLRLGGAYAFDEEAYKRFAPLGEAAGIPVQKFDFTPSEVGKIKFLVLDPSQPSRA